MGKLRHTLTNMYKTTGLRSESRLSNSRHRLLINQG